MNSNSKNKNTNNRSSSEKNEDPLMNFSHDAGFKMGRMIAGLTAQKSENIKSKKTSIEENPLKNLAFAVVAGALIGGFLTLLIKRKRDVK